MTLAEDISRENRVYVATCVPYDDEMKDRVRKHQDERDDTWKTVESALHLPGTVRKEGSSADVILIDCLTLWVTNMLMNDFEDESIEKEVFSLIDEIKKTPCPVILVSNEVGAGIVPENSLARKFRDIAGFVNQKVAKSADKVVWMVAGIPVEIKK